MKKINRTWKSLLFSMLVVPLMVTSAFAVAPPVPTFYVDMDVTKVGIQDTITMNAPGPLTTIFGIIIPDFASLGGNVNGLDFSLDWDNTELTYASRSLFTVPDLDSIPTASVGCGTRTPSSLSKCAWTTFNAPFQSGDHKLMSITWNAAPITDSFFDITFNMGSGESVQAGHFVKDEDGNWAPLQQFEVDANLQGGTVNIVPEPISSALFVIGGVVLGARRFMKKK